MDDDLQYFHDLRSRLNHEIVDAHEKGKRTVTINLKDATSLELVLATRIRQEQVTEL